MTVIVWDGKTLAADKMANISGLRRTVTKIYKHDGSLFFAAGDFGLIQELLAWYRNGAVKEHYPAFAKADNFHSPLHVITKDGTIKRYEQSGYPFVIEDKTFACGSGRDYALAVLEMGGDAIKAVSVASKFEADCGMGIDALSLDDETTTDKN